MPEFKIDRIRFRWRNAWTTSTVYAKDDVVKSGGNIYVCMIAHTSNVNFQTDLNTTPPRWTTMLEGQTYTDEWTPSTLYSINEIIKLGGTLYICTVGHISSANANNGIIGDESKWSVFAEGQNWRGTWQTATSYFKGDLVRYGGASYICDINHVSANAANGLEGNLANWSIYTRNLDYKVEWAPNTRYKPDDIVKYGGIVFRCIEGHTSAQKNDFNNPTYTTNGLGTGINFTVYRNLSIYFVKFIDSGTNFDVGDTITVQGSQLGGSGANNLTITVDSVETDGAILNFVTTGTASSNIDGLEKDIEKFEIIIEGIEFKGEFERYTRYKKNDIIRYGKSTLWICLGQVDDSTVPVDLFASGAQLDESNWSVWLPGFGYEAVWDELNYYQVGDVVMYGGYSYQCTVSNVNILPTVIEDSSSAWKLLVTGYKLRGDWRDAAAGYDSTFDSSQTDGMYQTGDVVRSGGHLYIAVRANIGHLPLETSPYDPGTDSPHPWQLLITGKKWIGPWYEIDPITSYVRYYYPGDVVTVAGTTFVCVEYHAADTSAAKPTLDLESTAVGPLWEKISQGGNLNVLENIGDIKVMGTDSVAFTLPIGSSGETLQVDPANALPYWNVTEESIKVFYVSQQGQDSVVNGKTLQTPFRTVKYACEYIQADLAARSPATIFIKTGIYEEIIPIKVPRNVALVGDELRSTIIRPANGYETFNMFLVNNGSGIRNMSLQGLSGTLGTANQYFTKRPTAGAYVSLDPGTGPSDSTVWITNKSPYVQNVSTFGDGCVGMKVDGNLHNSGNKSIVANDFTQILSGGIGYWCVGEGKSELVSVFTYYCHIGYLAENGGKVRATNGNNSYGDYGSVAEGFSLSETPITCIVDNQVGEALVDQIYNDENQIFSFGYSHTGQDYSSATVTITGSGAGASAAINYDNTRQQSISECRVTDTGASDIQGGSGYTSITGNARGGDTTSLLLANQYDPEYEKTCSETVANPINTLTVQNITGMRVGDPIIFPASGLGGILPDTIYYVIELVASNTIRISATKGGSALSLTNAVGSTYFVSALIVGQRILLTEGAGRGQYGIISYYDPDLKEVDVKRQVDGQPGFEHLLGGLAIETLLDQSTKYSIEPLIEFSAPPFAVNNITLPITAAWSAVASARLGGINVTVILSNSGGYYTSNGIAWSACSGLQSVAYLYTANSSTHLLAISTAAISRTTNGISWTTVTAPAGYGTFTSICAEQNVFIITTDQGFVLRSTNNGTSWTATSVTGWDGSTPALTHSAAGAGLFIVCNNLGQSFESADLGIQWNSGADIGDVSSNVTNLVYGNNKFVAACQDNPFDGSTVTNNFYYTLANQSTVASSTATVWQSSEVTPSAFPYTVGYAQGVFVAITAEGNLAQSQEGKHWKVLGSQIITDTGNFVKILGGTANGPLFIPLLDAATNIIQVVRYGAKALGRAMVTSSRITKIQLIEPGSGYSAGDPDITVTDNEFIIAAVFDVRVNNGTLGQPTFYNRGTGFLNVSATVSGDGFRDQYQTGKFINVKNLTLEPGPGDNIVFDNQPNTIYKLASFTLTSGTAPNIVGTLQILPGMGVYESPDHLSPIIIRQKYSQIRLTGHDFLDIGTGNKFTTNYPEIYVSGFTAGYEPLQFNEVVENGGGRVFYTSTDQDGNFRAGEQFKVEQASGIVSLSADFFQLDGLTQLALGGVVLGGTGAVINQFSTDGTMTANSDNIVPTQKAIVAYMLSRISGGGANLSVSTLRSGSIRIQNDQIDELAGDFIQIPVPVNFTQGVSGYMAAWAYFFKSMDN